MRSDGWTPERQLRFLQVLGRTRLVTKAAESVGMSRESAHRLRLRSEGSLFALLWDRCFEAASADGHDGVLTDGQLARLLGNCFRRKSATDGFFL